MVAVNVDRLVPSHPSIVEGAFEVEERFKQLCGDYLRIKGEELPIPSEIDRDIMRWRALRVRHKCRGPKCKHNPGRIIMIDGLPRCGNCGVANGDYRHTDSEVKSLKVVAAWLLEINATIRNQAPPKVDL